jgi:predicted transposase YbfD/YdcC
LLHLVNAYVPEEKGVIAQEKSELAGGEIKSAEKALSKINLKNKVVTGDAMFAQKSLCTQITKSKGDYLFKVKQNKKRIVDDINQEFCFYKSQNLSVT